ncbi:hypothetical protein KY360_01830 [Candidatus Woesearchaeota archaeon]|nr:hypothetical protein [Candidatus Woesearchaeota archaeon]
MARKKISRLTMLVIACLIITVVLNFFVVPHLITSKKIELSKGTCVDFCDSVSGTEEYSLIYNRRSNSFDCYCRDDTGWVIGKSSYPSLV